MNNTNAKDIEQQCSTCRHHHRAECHFASPNAKDGNAYWPKVEPDMWCSRWKKPSELAPASARATDAAIMAMMDVAGEIGADEFVLAIASEFGIHEKSARVKLQRLIARRKLAVTGDKLSLALPAAKKKDANGANGRPIKNEFSKWRRALAERFGDLGHAGLFSEMRDAARAFASISNASFSVMLTRAQATGEVVKLEDADGKGRYWIPAMPARRAAQVVKFDPAEELGESPEERAANDAEFARIKREMNRLTTTPLAETGIEAP